MQGYSSRTYLRMAVTATHSTEPCHGAPGKIGGEDGRPLLRWWGQRLYRLCVASNIFALQR